MDDDYMNEICQRGIGSRGGKGARKRRNGGKASTRSLSEKERKRDDLRLAALHRNLDGKFDAKDADEADALLSDHFKLPAMEKSTVSAFWATIAAEPGAQFVLMGDEQHREALKLVYALAVKVLTSDQFAMHVRIISERLGHRHRDCGRKRQNRKIVSFDDLLRAITRLRIDFGILEEEDAEKADYHHVWRMAAAIRYLESEGIAPHQVDAFHEKHGGGLDSWSRLAPKTDSKEKRDIQLEAKVISDDSAPPLDLDDPPDTNAKPRGRLTGFESILLRYCVNDLKLAPGGLLLLAVHGDATEELGAKIILKTHISKLSETSASKLAEECKIVKAFAKRLLGSTSSKSPQASRAAASSNRSPNPFSKFRKSAHH